MIRVYGLHGCDTCRKTRKWFEQQGLEFEFTDLREAPVGEVRLRRWLKALGEDKLMNRRSTTWRKLSGGERSRPPLELLAAYPALLKRPLVEAGDQITIGFRPEAWGTD